MSIDDDFHDLLFGVRRSIRYHTRRRSFYDRFNSSVNAVSVIMGSATVYGVLKVQAQDVAIIAAAIVTVLSAINLVVGSSRQARLHHDLCRRFIALEKKISTSSVKDAEVLSELIAERLDIESEEPPVLHVLNSICHNELARAMGYGPEHFAKIKFYQRWFSPIIDICENTIKVG